ncbi:glycoside hydrolase family 71 protein [Tsukamurella sp. 8F]|uniref:glycoside hydrolase family 71 protein n=1 Tax=unclassified Tsukamurella TaxID=2633480 RepID=UPI0023B9A4C9|nr:MULTISPECIES: glycoside hydrolase family 71 protein [unclassified Tsukamurella]MDF0531088.1 glycoside hydrolase family 71 protein [Tsukamurella sp. 8J]MDF0585445.1 glycoside hydrolase family 71 protein [Tsukamurella sp. 8F]
MALALVAVVAAACSGTEASAPTSRPTPHPQRMVFAHYLPHFPVSIDDQPAATDYYTTQYLAPAGEEGRHLAHGGYLRDRPRIRPPLDRDWRLTDLESEVRTARNAGIDGFTVDVIAPDLDLAVLTDLETAASRVGRFVIVPTIDMDGALGRESPATIADRLAGSLRSASAYHLPDGRPVLSAYRAERQSPAWWRSTLDEFAARLTRPVAFVPVLLDADRNLEAFAPISYGLGSWGGSRDPQTTDPDRRVRGSTVDLARRAHRLGRIWMSPIAFQDYRPDADLYYEAGGTETLDNMWAAAEDSNAEWAQLITWNDYAESTAFAPTQRSGHALLDLDAYRRAGFRSGPPEITRDRLFLVHRTQFATPAPSIVQTALAHTPAGTTAPVDVAEAVTLTTAPATVVITVGGRRTRCSVPAGPGHCIAPLAAGAVSAELERDGRVGVRTRSPEQVISTPRYQDLTYVVAE